MAVIQDEQGNNKPIVTDTSHVFDVNGNPLHGQLFFGRTVAEDDVEAIDGYAHESEIATINSNLTELLQSYETTKTADSNGRIFDTSFSTTNKHIVCAECTTQGAIALPFTLDNETLGVKCLAGSNMSALSGSLTVKVWYFIKS